MREGWRELTLGDVCDLVKRGVAPKYIESGGVCVVNQKCVRDHRINFKLSRRHNIEAKSINPERYIKFGDVLVNSTGTGTLGRVAQVRSELKEPTTVDTHVTIVRPLDGLFHPEFFGYMMIKIEDEIASSGEGASGQTELSRTKLANEFKVSFPISIGEQKHIVTILDEAFAGIDAVIANTEKNLANARELFESYLNHRLFNIASGESIQTLSCVTKLIVDCEHKTAPTQETGFPSIRTPNIGKGNLILDGVKRVSAETYKLWAHRGEPKPGDLILAREAPAGNVGVIPEGEKVCLGQRTVLIRPNEEMVNSRYLAYLILHPVIRRRLLSHSTGATVQHVNMRDIRALKLSGLPPLADQLLDVEMLEDVKSKFISIESIYQQKLNALNELKQSLLQKAFSGELTSDNNVIAFPDSKIAKDADPFSPEFAAKVLAFAYHRHAAKKRHNTFGHVKAQKILHLVESISGIDLDRHPTKDAAGPNDFQHMLRAEEWAKTNQFFEFVSRGEGKGYGFKKLVRYDELIAGLFATIKPYQQRLERVVDLLIPKDSREAELLATVHAAWNNLILNGCKITDKAIIREARENWHPNKMKIPLVEFQQALHFIQEKGLVPDGKAKRVTGQDSLF